MFEIPPKEKVEVAGPVHFLFPGPTSSLRLDWSQLDADQRCARTHATHCPAPASRLLTLTLHPLLLLSQFPIPKTTTLFIPSISTT